MTLFECYEQRKGALLSRLREASGLQQACAVMQDVFDIIQYEFCESCKSPVLRESTAYMMNAAKISFPLVECVSDVKIWHTENGAAAKGKGKGRLWAAVSAVTAISMLVGMTAAFVSQHPDFPLNEIRTGIYIAAAVCVLLFAAGGMFFMRAKPTKGTEDIRAEISVNSEDVVRRMTAVILQIDKNLAMIEADEIRKAKESGDSDLKKDEIELMSALLEGRYSDSAEFAQEQLEEVEHYLSSHGILICDYTPEYARRFELLPGEQTKTLRPAMLCGGKLIKKGLATECAVEGA
ncbi:MAG: hypothetical protein RSA97_06825, partial [Oscillospiraceae bacterium]